MEWHHTFALQVRPGGFEDRKEDGEQLHQVSSDVTRRRFVVHHVQSVEGLQGQTDSGWFSMHYNLVFCPLNLFLPV